MVTEKQIVGRYGTDADHDSLSSAQNAQKRVYLMPDFCQISLPLNDPGDSTPSWQRVNGSRTYTIYPKRLRDEAGNPKYLWSYGKIARLLFIWITTQVVKQKNQHQEDNRLVMLPDTLRELMEAVGIKRKPTGGDYKRFRQQLEAITHFCMTIDDDTPKSNDGSLFAVAERWEIGWDKATPEQTRGMKPGSYIKLTADAWKRMSKGVPLDADIVEVLSCGHNRGQDLDIYAWLTQRIYALNHSRHGQDWNGVLITWEQLSNQLGTNYDYEAAPADFVRNIKKSLQRVQLLWNYHATIVRGKGIRIYRSPMSVKAEHKTSLPPKPPQRAHAVHQREKKVEPFWQPRKAPKNGKVSRGRKQQVTDKEYVRHFIGSSEHRKI